MKSMTKLVAAAAGVLAGLALAATAQASTTLVAGTGWVDDTANSYNTPSDNSTITITIDPGQTDIFSLSDCCVTGDIYKVTVDGFVSYNSIYHLFPTFWAGTGSSEDKDWANADLSHLQISFTDTGSTPLTLTMVIVDTTNWDQLGHPGNYPAGFEYRLDTVPEPASWALMIGGIGLTGFALRRRYRLAKAA
jgi:PEP-CTERM motif